MELLKVRGSYARVGSAFERFIANPQHAYSVSTASYATNASYPLALKPEYTSSWEAGLQARLANGLSLDATWYYTHTKDQTFDVALSAGSGYDKAYIQTGDILNTGFTALPARETILLRFVEKV